MKFPNFFLWTCICFIISINYSFAQYSMSGTVLNSSGNLVDGATVRLAIADVSVTTSGSGTWSMAFSSITQKAKSNPSVRPQLKGNILQFSVLSHSDNVYIKIYDLQGRILTSNAKENLAPGTYQVKINHPNLNGKMCLLKVDIGSQSFTRKLPLINTNDTNAYSLSLGNFTQSDILSNTWSRNSTVADTIVVTKSGYQEGRKAIAAYSGTHVIIISAY